MKAKALARLPPIRRLSIRAGPSSRKILSWSRRKFGANEIVEPEATPTFQISMSVNIQFSKPYKQMAFANSAPQAPDPRQIDSADSPTRSEGRTP
jgi:hypothetical protein